MQGLEPITGGWPRTDHEVRWGAGCFLVTRLFAAVKK